EHSLVPLRHTFIADTETPVSAYLKLRGSGPSFLLESAEGGQRVGRWSFLGVHPRSVMRLDGDVLSVDGEERAFEDPYEAVSHEPCDPPRWESNVGNEGYARGVEVAKDYIRAGDIYQVVPSQRWSADAPVEAFSIYRGLRAVNPSPYMYFLDFGDFQIAGASPEPLLTVTGRRVSTRPIAGTRPRGKDLAGDERIAAELLADEKERAEHVML